MSHLFLMLLITCNFYFYVRHSGYYGFEIFYYYSHSIVPGLCVSFLLQHNKMPLAYQVKTHLLSPSSGCQKLGLRVAGFSRVLQECNQGVSQVAFSSGALCAFFGVFRLLAESSSLYLKDRGACFLDDCWLGVSWVPTADLPKLASWPSP